LQDKSVDKLFEEQVRLKPDAVAIVYAGKQITYGIVNQKANQVAHYLIQQGIKPGSFIAVGLERSLELVISILGILKAGCAYVPIDPNLPMRRQQYILSDSGSKLLLISTDQEIERYASFACAIVQLKKIESNIEEDKDAINPGLVVSNRQIAYLIYTSGTSGSPKGVVIEHRALVNYISYIEQAILNSQPLCIAYINAAHTDLGHTSLFSAILYGKRLYIEKAKRDLDIPLLVKNLYREKVNFLKITPSYYHILNEELNHYSNMGESLQFVLGGESLPKDYLQSDRDITNHYGPTETTVGVSICKLSSNQQVSIGKAISNIQIYILDENLTLLPDGIIGQIYIGGVGLAQGYMNRPELTAEKFIANPFGVGTRLYKTGDVGRYLPDGRIDFLGRSDDQVKIRGYRIECKEIESLLKDHGDIKDAYVTCKANPAGDKQLIGYIVPGDFTPNVRELEEYLKEYLPEYMVPSCFVMLEKMPLTVSGKLDRKALPDSEFINAQEYVAPRNDLEAKICAIWEEVLKIQGISVNDNFFRIGGHSLLATQVISRVRKQCKQEVKLITLFDHPTIVDFCKVLSRDSLNKSAAPLPALMAIEKRPNKPALSYAQQRLWFLDKLLPDVTLYNMPIALELRGPLNREALRNTVNQIADRHEILRTVFKETESGEGYQEILSQVDLFEEIDLSDLADQGREIEAYKSREENWHFDLSKEPLCRVKLLVMSEDYHVLFITMHHIISDGWSIGVLMDEISVLYGYHAYGKAADLPKLQLQYVDYSLWQRSWLQGEVLERQLDYWKKKLEGIPDIIDLPTDYARPKFLSYEGGYHRVEFDKELSESIKSLCQEKGVSLYMLLLSALDILLHKLSGSTDIVVGSPVANRHYQETEDMIGFFVNTLVSRIQVAGNKSFDGLLSEVKSDVLESYTHQDVPFEQLVDVLSMERSTNRNPIFQVRLVVNEQSEKVLSLGQIQTTYLPASIEQSKFDLLFRFFSDSTRGIALRIEYLKDLYTLRTIRLFGCYYKNILQQIVKNFYVQIRDIQLVTKEEEN
jgi:amino acid adenylation domain-containing protein